MTRLFYAPIFTVLLASCAFAPLRIAVGNITLPGDSSLGRVCYVQVTEGSRVGFKSATYRASALYISDALLGSNDVTIRVYGRESAPPNPCVSVSDADTPLSEPLTLSPDETKEVEIGGSAYGGALADLIVEDTYWLGAALTGGTFLSLEERIELTDGVISVFF